MKYEAIKVGKAKNGRAHVYAIDDFAGNRRNEIAVCYSWLKTTSSPYGYKHKEVLASFQAKEIAKALSLKDALSKLNSKTTKKVLFEIIEKYK